MLPCASRASAVERQLNQALCNFALVEDRLRTEQEMGKCFSILKQEKADLLRAKLRASDDDRRRSKLDERNHNQQLEIASLSHQIFNMQKKQLDLEKERDFLRQQGADFVAYYAQVEQSWNEKFDHLVLERNKLEIEATRTEMQFMEERERSQSLRTELARSADEVSMMRSELNLLKQECSDKDNAIYQLRLVEAGLERDKQASNTEFSELTVVNAKQEASMRDQRERVRKLESDLQASFAAETQLRRDIEHKTVEATLERGTVQVLTVDVAKHVADIQAKQNTIQDLVQACAAKDETVHELRKVNESIRRTLAAQGDEVTTLIASAAKQTKTTELLEEEKRKLLVAAEAARVQERDLQRVIQEKASNVATLEIRCSTLDKDKASLINQVANERISVTRTEEQYNSARAQASALQEQLVSAQKDLTESRCDWTLAKASLTKQLDGLTAQNVSLRAEVCSVTQDVKSANSEIDTLDEKVATLLEENEHSHRAKDQALKVVADLTKELKHRDDEHHEEVQRIFGRFRDQFRSMDMAVAGLPTVAESRRRAEEVLHNAQTPRAGSGVNRENASAKMSPPTSGAITRDSVTEFNKGPHCYMQPKTPAPPSGTYAVVNHDRPFKSVTR